MSFGPIWEVEMTEGPVGITEAQADDLVKRGLIRFRCTSHIYDLVTEGDGFNAQLAAEERIATVIDGPSTGDGFPEALPPQ